MSAAEQANMQEYDVIVDINGTEMNDSHDLRKFLYTEADIGDEVEVTFYRDGNRETVTITLQEQQSY